MRILVNGAKGKMGKAIVEWIQSTPELILAGEAEYQDDLAAMIRQNQAEVVIDFTRPEARMSNVEKILHAGAAAVVGTTGFTPADLETISAWVKNTGKGCVIAPNFIIGNVLMQLFAKKAAEYYEYAEIIEYHHEEKVDYPSGTAVKTAEMMSSLGKAFNPRLGDKVAKVEGARGGNFNGIRMHAIRMPSYIASQEVILGAPGERLTIRHDNTDRKAYMPGIHLACRHIVGKAEMIYGLEHLL